MTSNTHETLMRPATRSLPRDVHDQLAEVRAVQQAHEPARCVLESFDHLFAIPDAPGLEPAAHVLDEGRVAVVVIEDDESLDPDAPAQHAAEERRRPIDPRRQLLQVVPADQAAQWHPRCDIEERCDRIEDRPADALEVDVDSFRASGGELLGKIGAAVIDAGIEAESADRVTALLGAPGHTHDATALELGD